MTRDSNARATDGTRDQQRVATDGDQASAGATGNAGSRRSMLREVVVVVACVLLLIWVVQTFIGRQYVIPSESMEPTLHGCAGCSNDRIVIDKLAYRFGDPKPGDVVVFNAPTESWDGGWTSRRSSNAVIKGMQEGLSWFGFAPPDENNLVKRVIATGGQTVACKNADGRGVTVDGKPLREPYIDTALQADTAAGTPTSCYGTDFGPITVPDGNVWVMGDNRLSSADSRAHITDELNGTVPVGDIRGKVRFILYPVARIGGVGAVNPQS
ncbi:MAG: signal peptidase I [Gordonia amarae]